MVAFSRHTTISGATTNTGTPTIPIMCVFLEKYGNKSNPDKPYFGPVMSLMLCIYRAAHFDLRTRT